MRKYGFLFAIVFLLFISTIGNTQEISNTDPDVVRIRTANALRAGDIDLALKGFYPDPRSLSIIPTLDASQRNKLAHWLENAKLIKEHDDRRIYRYIWTEESGEHMVDFTMQKDFQGKWVITNW